MGTPIDQNKLQQLNVIINKYNKEADLSITLVPDGSQAFNSLRKSYGMFKNVHTLIVCSGSTMVFNRNTVCTESPFRNKFTAG